MTFDEAISRATEAKYLEELRSRVMPHLREGDELTVKVIKRNKSILADYADSFSLQWSLNGEIIANDLLDGEGWHDPSSAMVSLLTKLIAREKEE